MAAISPAGLGSTDYTVSASRGLVVDLRLDVGSSPPFPALQLRFPAAANGVAVSLERGARSLALPTTNGSALNDATTVATRRVSAQTSTAGDQIVIDCEIRATASAAENEVWSLRAHAPDPQAWLFSQDDDNPADPVITRVMCDPVSEFTISAETLANGTVREKDAVTLTAAAGTGTAAAPTVVGAPLPGISYRWNKAGAIAVVALPSCSASPVLTFQAPPVPASQPCTLSVDVWFETDCSTVGFLSSTSGPQTLTVVPRPANAMPDLVGESADAVVSLLSCVNMEGVDHCLNFLGHQLDALTKNTPRDLGNFFFTVTRSRVKFDLQGDPSGARIVSQFPPEGVLVPPEATISWRYTH